MGGWVIHHRDAEGRELVRCAAFRAHADAWSWVRTYSGGYPVSWVAFHRVLPSMVQVTR